MKLISILAILLLIASSAESQEIKTDRKKITFSSVNQAGVIIGSSRESWLIQTINGIKRDKWSSGIGVGVDFYVERGVPLFLDIRRDLFNKSNTPFIYADGGAYFPWLNFIEKERRMAIKRYPGLYYDIGGGWKLTGKHNRSFIVSAGYTIKQAKEKSTSNLWMPIAVNTPQEPDYYKYKYQRIVLKVGFQL
jgi:hypothetical protein